MKSESIILIATWVAMVLYWMDFVQQIVPIAMGVAWLLMWAFGFFRREKGIAAFDKAVDEENNLNERQKDFRRKLAEAKQQTFDKGGEDRLTQATINMIDQDGIKSSITIKPNGEIVVDGDPDPEIIIAVQMLEVSILEHGVDAVAVAIGKEIDKINRGEK